MSTCKNCGLPITRYDSDRWIHIPNQYTEGRWYHCDYAKNLPMNDDKTAEPKEYQETVTTNTTKTVNTKLVINVQQVCTEYKRKFRFD